jgi:hypothetical protein
MFGQHRQGDFFHFPHVGEPNQFEILLQHRGAQRPEVGGIVVLHVHEITDVGILRMIVNLGLQREVAARFQVLETLPEREQGVGQVIERPEMKNDIELAGTAERFGATQFELGRRARQLGEKTCDLNMARVDVNAGRRKAIFHRGMDRIVAGIAADIEQTTSSELPKRNCRCEQREFPQGSLGKWPAPGAIPRRHAVIEVEPMAPRLPTLQLFLQRLGRDRRVQREKFVFHFKMLRLAIARLMIS